MSEYFERELVTSFRNIGQLLEKIDVKPPIFVFLSLVSVLDYKVGVDAKFSLMLRDQYESPINRDNGLLPEIMFDSLSTDELPRKLKQHLIWFGILLDGLFL